MQDLSFEQIQQAFTSSNIEFHQIDCVNWAEYPDTPSVEFAVAHTDDMIYVMYNVKEESIRAFYTEDKDCKPFEDSCVEFFISMDASRVNYYNIESNCVGALQMKSGTDDFKNRVRYGDDITSQIKRYTSLPQAQAIETQQGSFEWSLVMAIPVKLLGVDDDFTLSSHKAYANFYKCGDMLPRPHYLSWNPIDTPSPSFHQPKFFGELHFE